MDDYTDLNECLCESAIVHRTRLERVTDGIKILILGTMIVTVAALAAVGLLSVYFAVALNS